MGDSKQNRRLTMARFEKDMTQKDLAERVGISRQTMNAIDQSESEIVPRDMLGAWEEFRSIILGRKAGRIKTC